MLDDSNAYHSLVARIDAFINEKLERGYFPASVIGTELIYQELNNCFPDERDALATFFDRITAQHVRVAEDPHTGADLLVGLKLKPEHVPMHSPRADAFRRSLSARG